MTRAHWLSPCRGAAHGWRVHDPEALRPVAEAEARILGATRPSDISGLDVTGMPCWQVTRPDALDVPGNVTVLNGKGRTIAEAALGAWMEFLERHWAERSQVEIVARRSSELAHEARSFIPPAAIPLPWGTPDPGDSVLAWTRGTTSRGEDVWLPAHDVLCPFEPPAGTHNPLVSRSTGLASGGHLTEAVLHAVLEVIERDAVAVAELGRVGTTVDLTTAGSPWLQDQLCRLDQLGFALEVKQLPAVGGVAVFLATVDDRSGQPMRMACGHAAHIDPFLALDGAVQEALQARAAMISGAREDLEDYRYLESMTDAEARREFAWWLDATCQRTPAPRAPQPEPEDLASVVLELETALFRQSFQPLVVVELSPASARIPVVRAVVPGCSDFSHRRLWQGRRIRIDG